MCVRCKGSHRRAGHLTEPDRGHSRESSCSYRTLGRVWTVNILRTDWTSHSCTPELEMMQKAYHYDTLNKSSSKLFGSIKNGHLESCGETNWKLQRSQERRTVFLPLHSLLFPLIQTLPLFYQQIFRTELKLLMTVDYFPKCLVVRLYNRHNFTSIWLAARGYFPNSRGSTRSDELNVKYSSWLKL